MLKTILPLSLVLFLIGTDEYILSALLGPMGAAFDVPVGRAALLVTAFALPYAILAPVFGSLSDRWGRGALLFPGMTAFILATLGTAVAPDFASALVSRILTGAAAAAITPTVFALLGDLVPPRRRPTAMGLVQLGLTLGLVLSPAMGAMSVEVVGWRVSFGAIAMLGFVALAILLAVIPQAAPSAGEPVPEDRGFRRRDARLAVAVMGLGLGVAIGTFALIGVILREAYGMGAESLAAAYLLFGIATVAGNAVTGIATARLGGPRGAMLVALVGVAADIGVVCFGMAGGSLVAGCGLTLWAVCGGFGAPAQQALLADAGGAARGRVLAWGASAMNLGIGVSGLAAGQAYQAGGAPAVGAVAGLALAVAVALQAAIAQPRPATESG